MSEDEGEEDVPESLGWVVGPGSSWVVAEESWVECWW